MTARWSNLLLASYPVPADLLRPLLPRDLELDLRDGQAYVSLVAFDFVDTRVWGIPWPGYRNFPELNLRTYVHQGNDRGVVFLREFVPKRLVAWLARMIYNEPYLAAPMISRVDENDFTLTVEHRLTWAGKTHSLRATGDKPAYRPDPNTLDHFFKEPGVWGFNTKRSGETARYQVVHPVWDVYPVREFRIDLDWEQVYGPEWKVLQEARPISTILAAGSPVQVFPKGTLAVSP